jgi:hypothetical protein
MYIICICASYFECIFPIREKSGNGDPWVLLSILFYLLLRNVKAHRTCHVGAGRECRDQSSTIVVSY